MTNFGGNHPSKTVGDLSVSKLIGYITSKISQLYVLNKGPSSSHTYNFLFILLWTQFDGHETASP